MIKVEHIEVTGWEAAIRGMRNPMNSWEKSDTQFEGAYGAIYNVNIGRNDLNLMKRLFNAGTEHRKYLRMINVTMDITAPLYWWKEFDTYKVGTVANSCSTMHKIAAKEFELDDFSHEHLTPWTRNLFGHIIDNLEANRKVFLALDGEDQKLAWWQMIQLLPSSYNQKRTVQFNYETLFNIIRQREHHKLDEWVELVDILKTLPYVSELLGGAE